MDREKLAQIFLIILGVLLLVNLIFLDIRVFRKGEGGVAEIFITHPSPSPAQVSSSPEFLRQESETSSCSPACLEKINEATRSLALPTPKTIVQRVSQTSVKEFYIPLGSGSSFSSTWLDIKNAEAFFDPKNYGEMKSITFEALMHIPTANGRVYARLYNVDDKVGMIETEIWAEGSSGIRVESSPFSLPSEKKLYRVQLKSTLGYEAILDLARLKVIVE